MKKHVFSVVVEAREAALAYRDGRLAAVLQPGRYRRAWRTDYVAVDLAERLTMVAPQEIPSADGVVVKVSGAVRWEVVDPVAFTERTRTPDDLVYLAGQLALRSVLAELPVETISRAVRHDTALAEHLTTVSHDGVADLGVRVLRIVVRDVILPPEVRTANLALVTARTRGQAQLEAARAETAALRSLANGAKVLDASPALTQLRLVQAASENGVVNLQLGASRD